MAARAGRALLWTLTGTALLLLALEAGFRVTGAVVRLSRRVPAAGPATRTVLCEGDSFTYGVGGRGFPSQLEELLRARVPGPVRVVNMGMPGLNTALLADMFESHLEVYRPDVVLIVVGEDNYWNRVRLETVGRGLGRAAALDALLMNSRVYKFLKIAWIGMHRSGLHREDPESGGPPVRRRATIPDVDAFLEAQSLEARGECERAVPLYRKFAASNPDDAAGVTGIARCLMRQDRAAEAAVELEKAVRLRPSPEVERAHSLLGWARWRSGEKDRALAAWRRGQAAFPASRAFAEDIARASGSPAPRSADADEGRVLSESFRADIRRICAAAAARGVPVVFGSYPDAVHPEVYETAREAGQTFIDFKELFKRRFKSRTEYLSADNCHCNTEGYRAMAEAFAEEVLKLWQPPQKTVE